MKKVLCVALSLLCVIGLAACGSNDNEEIIELPLIEEGVHVDFIEGQGQIRFTLLPHEELTKDVYVVQLLTQDTKELVDTIELSRDEGFTNIKHFPVGDYYMQLVEKGDDTGSYWSIKGWPTTFVREGGVLEQTIEITGSFFEITPEMEEHSKYDDVTFVVALKHNISTIYTICATNVDDPNDVQYFDISFKEKWQTTAKIPIGTYNISLYERTPEGEIGKEIAITGCEEPIKVMGGYGFGRTIEPVDKSLWGPIISDIEKELTDTEGSGWALFTINVPDNFPSHYECILVQFFNVTTGEIIDEPVYKLNNWRSTTELPVGRYMTYSVIAVGDDPLNLEWEFEIGYKFILNNEESHSFEINPGGSLIEPPEPGGMVTDTEIKPEDLMTDEEIEALKNAENNE